MELLTRNHVLSLAKVPEKEPIPPSQQMDSLVNTYFHAVHLPVLRSSLCLVFILYKFATLREKTSGFSPHFLQGLIHKKTATGTFRPSVTPSLAGNSSAH